LLTYGARSLAVWLAIKIDSNADLLGRASTRPIHPPAEDAATPENSGAKKVLVSQNPRKLYVALATISVCALLLAYREAVLLSSYLRYVVRVEVFSDIFYDKIAFMLASMMVYGAGILLVLLRQSRLGIILLLIAALGKVLQEMIMVYGGSPFYFVIPGVELVAVLYLIKTTFELQNQSWFKCSSAVAARVDTVSARDRVTQSGNGVASVSLLPEDYEFENDTPEDAAQDSEQAQRSDWEVVAGYYPDLDAI